MEKKFTVEELKKRRQVSLVASDKAVIKHPEAYLEIKRLAKGVIEDTVDIGDYFKTAGELTRLLSTLTRGHAGTVFTYFQKNIDPRQCGQAAFFRAMCVDLEQQCGEFDKWRISIRRLTRVK
jgi:hypothetical protein